MSEPNGNANTLTGYGGKDPLVTSHGDALLDQDFQSLKSKEVRDSMSPTHELKFHSMTLAQPNTTGWDVQTSSEVSPDGRAYRTETLAKTDGVEKLNGGGVAEFKGRNEQRSSASHQGDDKNFVKKAAESSNTHLQEKVVFGDEASGRTEMKMSSTSTSSSSKFVSSSSTVEYDDEPAAAGKPRYLLDAQPPNNRQQIEQIEQQQQLREEQRRREEQHFVEQREQRFQESREQSKSTRNVETQQHFEENKRYVDMDKASPEYQRHVQHLMSQPGEIISNTVEYPKPNVKMITTVKRLPDGTIVKNKRYETEQLNSANDSVRQQQQTQTQTQTQNRQQQQQRHTTTQSQSQSQPRDVVDHYVDTVRSRPIDAEELHKQETFSSVKKSSRRFSTETTSETIEETIDDRNPPSSPQKLQAAPSVKPHKPTQEFHGQRPTTPQRQSPSSDFSTHGFPSVKSNKPTQEFLSQRPSTEEIIVVKSEKSRNVKQTSSSQRTTETQYIGDDQPSWEQPASPRRPPIVDDFSTHGFPSVRDQADGEVLQQQSTTSMSSVSRNKSNAEHIIETQLAPDYDDAVVEPLQSPRRSQPLQQGFPAARSPNQRNSPQRKPSTPAAGRSTTETTTTTSVTRRQLQKEREVDAAHRAFAASLRSSSPAESTTSTGSHSHSHHPQARRDSGHQSIASNRTYRRDGREGSHDSHAPSETSRISSTTVTRGQQPAIKSVVGKQHVQQVTKVKTTRNVQGSNETIDLVPQRSPKSPTTPTTPKAGTSTTTTTTTTTTSTLNKPVPAAPAAATTDPATPVTDNQSQYTYATTKPADIFSLPPPTSPTINNNNNNNNPSNNNNNNNNEPTLTTISKKSQNLNLNNNDSSDSELLTKTQLSTNDATTSSVLNPVKEALCVRRNYYKLGPSDKDNDVKAVIGAEPTQIIAEAVTSTETAGKA